MTFDSGRAACVTHTATGLAGELRRTKVNYDAEPGLRSPPWIGKPELAISIFAETTARRDQLIQVHRAQVAAAAQTHIPEDDYPPIDVERGINGAVYFHSDMHEVDKGPRISPRPLQIRQHAVQAGGGDPAGGQSSVVVPHPPASTGSSRSRTKLHLSLGGAVAEAGDVRPTPLADKLGASTSRSLWTPRAPAHVLTREEAVKRTIHRGKPRMTIAPSYARFAEALEDEIDELEIELRAAQKRVQAKLASVLDPGWLPPAKVSVKTFMQTSPRPSGIVAQSGRHTYGTHEPTSGASARPSSTTAEP